MIALTRRHLSDVFYLSRSRSRSSSVTARVALPWCLIAIEHSLYLFCPQSDYCQLGFSSSSLVDFMVSERKKFGVCIIASPDRFGALPTLDS